jgi:hypothetical protein
MADLCDKPNMSFLSRVSILFMVTSRFHHRLTDPVLCVLRYTLTAFPDRRRDPFGKWETLAASCVVAADDLARLVSCDKAAVSFFSHSRAQRRDIPSHWRIGIRPCMIITTRGTVSYSVRTRNILVLVGPLLFPELAIKDRVMTHISAGEI